VAALPSGAAQIVPNAEAATNDVDAAVEATSPGGQTSAPAISEQSFEASELDAAAEAQNDELATQAVLVSSFLAQVPCSCVPRLLVCTAIDTITCDCDGCRPGASRHYWYHAAAPAATSSHCSEATDRRTRELVR
jgi:hypothetical protein